MNTKASIAFVAALLAMLGCSTPQPASPVAAVPPEPAVPAPEISIDLPLEEPMPAPFGRVCKLGTSCLAMDPRPFEPCLLSTKNCRDKATEPLLVEQPKSLEPPEIIETAE